MVNKSALQVVCELARKHKVHPDEILRSRVRTQRIARIRQTAYREVKEAKGWSACRVAQFFGRHPSTIDYALKRYPAIVS